MRRRSPAPTASTASRGRWSPQGTDGRVWERTYPYAWLGVLADVAPVDRRADLRLAPRRLRAALDALAVGLAAVPAGRPRREDRGLVRRPDLGRPGHPLRPRRLGAGDRPDHREVGAADALVRQRADAPRPAVPRRGRRAHRAADRRQGPQPRRRRRDAAGHGAGPAAQGASRPTWSTATPTARWPGSGGARTSPGS